MDLDDDFIVNVINKIRLECMVINVIDENLTDHGSSRLNIAKIDFCARVTRHFRHHFMIAKLMGGAWSLESEIQKKEPVRYNSLNRASFISFYLRGDNRWHIFARTVAKYDYSDSS